MILRVWLDRESVEDKIASGEAVISAFCGETVGVEYVSHHGQEATLDVTLPRGFDVVPWSVIREIP